MHLLEVRDLDVHFPAPRDLGGGSRQLLKAVNGVSCSVAAGETLGLVGESGCGKTTLARAIVRLIEPTAGSICLEGEDLTRLRPSELRARRHKFQMVFQDPYGSLDPRMTVGQALEEPLDLHWPDLGQTERRDRVAELLRAVGLDPAHVSRYPHEFSGGQRQRIGIARALAVQPRLLVCDEAVSALDVSVQAQIVNLLQDLQQRRGLAYLFIAHDLAVVGHLSHRIAVMYLGSIVETGPAPLVLSNAAHPYTQALISAVPTLEPASGRRRILLPGEPPSPINPPKGCPFHPRCPVAESRCRTEPPGLREVAPGHLAACHLADSRLALARASS